jgi:hypothetical protein
MTYSTDFEFTVERDDQSIDLTIFAEGEVEYADRSVGIMSAGVIGATVTATDVDGQPFTLTSLEEAEAERKGEEMLNQLFYTETVYGDL